MSSIPYDPTLVLGNLIDLKKIENLQKLAELQKPLDLAFAKLNNVTKTSYKLKMVQTEMINLGVGKDKLKGFNAELEDVMRKIADAAISYGVIALDVVKKVQKEKLKQGQKTISLNIESPLDFGKSSVKQFPIAYDSLTFDVSYVRNEENVQSDYSHANTVSKVSSDKGSHSSGNHNNNDGSTENSTTLTQTQNHDIEGTVVISARATHKNADVIEPFVIDPEKAVTAWNYTYPKDLLNVDPQSIMKAALDDFKTKSDKKPAINILSSVTKGSSFTGLVHILKKESSDSSQSASAYASGIKNSQEFDQWYNASNGGYGNSSSFSSSAKSMLSDSEITSHCSVICRGLIPSIVASDVTSTIQSMDMDPEAVMGQLAAIQDAGNQGVNSSMQSQSEEGKRGGQFMKLNSEYMKNSVSAISEKQNANNKVIDVNSLMTAFEDYCAKAMAGESGIPINFYFKRLTKSDVAKVYLRRFYPSGITSAKDATRGQLGQEPEPKKEE